MELTQHMTENDLGAYSKPCQISKVEHFAKNVQLLSQNAPSQMFDRILNTSVIYTNNLRSLITRISSIKLMSLKSLL